jgi:hypothetical protein
MKVNIIGSGSRGNAATIDDTIVIDAGCRGIACGTLVLLTHAHTDHTQYVSELRGLPIYCSTAAADTLNIKYSITFNAFESGDILSQKNGEYQYRIEVIELKHDAPCHGFDITRFKNGALDSRILWLTDFNTIVDEEIIIERLREGVYTHLYVECNNTLTLEDINEIYIGDEIPKDEFHRRKSFQNHCNVQYLIKLFSRAGFSNENRCNVPLTLLHKSSYYYTYNPERIVELCLIANVKNPLL